MGYLSILIRTALGGLSNNIIKLTINTIPIYYFLVLRYLGIILMVFLTPSNGVKEGIRVLKTNKEMRNSILLSGFMSGLGTIFFYIALSKLPIAVVVLFDGAFNIIFVLLIGMVFLGHVHTLRFYLHFILLFPAMYLIAFKNLDFNFSLSLIGVVMLSLNGLVLGIETHLTKAQVDKVSVAFNVMVKTVISLAVAIICIPLFNNKIEDLINGFTMGVGLLVLYNIVSGYLIKMLHTKAIKDIGATQTTVFTTLTPVFSILIGMLIFKEYLTLSQWMGVVLLVYTLYNLRE